MAGAQFYVAGTWRSSDRVRAVRSPFDGSLVGEVCQATPGDLADAISSAAEAFAATKKLPSYVRTDILAKTARRLTESKEEFSRLITGETGKPISLARNEVDRSIFTFSIAAEEARRIEGTVLPLDLNPQSRGRFGLVRRFPLGPVAAITPFNFPLNLVAHKVAPAIAAGNSVVLKPSSSAPHTALLLAKILDETDLPKGAFSVVPVLADEAEQLIVDPRIKLVSFTGSPAVGWPLKARAGKKRVLLELGGNAGVIVEPDADQTFACSRILTGAFSNAGQSCISVQRVYIHEKIWEEFTQRLTAGALSVATGDPQDERTQVGPMINDQAAQKVEGWIAEAVSAGARLLCGGKRLGATVWPTILTDVDPALNISCQEAFAPVMVLERYSRFQDAVQRVNASAFGLQAGVFTSGIQAMFHAFEELEVGGVVVNDVPTYRVDHMPYGGVKDSGFGREGVRYAIEEMTELKLLVINTL